MDIVIALVSAICLLLGGFLCLTGGVGILRFPDFYSRIHATGVTDTLGAGLILIGLMLQAPDVLVLVKLVIILMMTLFINPVATHALAQAALKSGLSPLLQSKKFKGG